MHAAGHTVRHKAAGCRSSTRCALRYRTQRQNGLFTLSCQNVLSGQGFLCVKMREEDEASENKSERLSELREVIGDVARSSSAFVIPPAPAPRACRRQEEPAFDSVLSIITPSTWPFKLGMQPRAHCGASRLAFSSIIKTKVFWKDAGAQDASSPEPTAASASPGPSLLLGQEGECSGGKPGPLKQLKPFLPQLEAAKNPSLSFFESSVSNIYEYLKALVWQRICIPA